MRVVSINGIVNNWSETYGGDFKMWLEQPYSDSALKLTSMESPGGEPRITAARRQPKVFSLHVLVGVNGWGVSYDETTRSPLREALLVALDTEQTAVTLVVSDDDGANERYVYVVCQKPDEQPSTEGMGVYFVATLTTHGDTRWRMAAGREVTWDVTASGETLAVTNGGSLAARPVYTIEPTAGKSGGNAFAFRMFCAVKWPGRTARQWPTDVTGGAWDTATLIGAGDIYGAYGENNIAVMVDGAMSRRWIEGYDSANSSVWCNLDWIYCPPATLLTGFGSGDVVTEIAADGDISAFPFSGILQIDDERFTYAGKDNATRRFTGVMRAAKASAAGTHVAGDGIYLIQHDIWVVYGGTGYWLNTYDLTRPDGWAGALDDDGYSPMFSLSYSSNLGWRWDEFGTSGQPRAAAWRPGGAMTGTGTAGEPFDELVLLNNSSLVEQAGESFWTFPVALNLAIGRIVGRGRSFEPGQKWEVGLYAGGGVYINVPELESMDVGLVDFDLDVVEARYAEDVRFYQRCAGAAEARLDIVELIWTDAPVVVMASPVAMYDLALTLGNVTTGEAITLTHLMAVNEQIEVDTEAHTVTLLTDGSSQYQALARDSRRREIMTLAAGVNTLKVTEAGLTGVRVHIAFEERRYG